MTSANNSFCNGNFVERLTSKNDDEKAKAAQDLFDYLSGELAEKSADDVQLFLDHCDKTISDLLNSSDPNERKGGIYMMVCLIKQDKNIASTKLSRFSNYLRSTFQYPDIGVVELAARAVGHLALSYGSYITQYVNFEIKRCFESLQFAEKNESRRVAAVLVLKEIAQATPTLFFQHIHQFYDSIFNAIKDSKPVIREQAIVALRAALIVTLQRETKQHQRDHWYKLCYEEARKCFEESFNETAMANVREDKAHSALLIINELLIISNLDGERIRHDVENMLDNNVVADDYEKVVGSTASQRFFNHKDVENVYNWLLAPRKKTHFESRTCRKYVVENYDALINSVLKCRWNRQVFNQQILLEILPRLAAFNRDSFIVKYLEDSVNFILHVLITSKEKTNAFNAIGFIAVFVQDKLSPFLPRIFDQIRLSIAATKDALKKKQITSSDPIIFNCLTLLTKYVGIETFSCIRSIIDQVLTSGLSYNLVIALNEIVTQIPELKRDVENGLHKQLSIIIMQKPPPNMLDFPRPIELPSTPVPVSDPQLTILALNTLSKFKFSRHVTESFLKFITAGYLNSKFVEIRLTATRTVVLLLSPFIKIFNDEPFKHKEKVTLELIREIMNKLMALCVADKNQEVRLCVLRSLMADDIFYIHLAQAEILQLIFVVLQDESFEMRQFVVCSLGKLSEVNPAIIMPVLRRVLIQILNELNFNGLNRNEEQSARLLSQLIFSAPKFIKPYVPSTLKVLVDKLNSTAPNQTDVIINVLHALGELVNVDGLDFIKEQENLTPLLIEFMQDPNSLEKREVALWTLCQLIQNTGYVVEPYEKHPDLLPTLFRILKTEQITSIRHEVIRILGLIGALDPYKQRLYSMRTSSSSQSVETLSFALSMPESKDTKDARQEIVQWFHWEKCTLEEFYPAFAIANLMQMLSDPSLSQHHTVVVQSLMFMFKSLGSKCLPYIDQVMPNLLKVIRYSDSQFREFLFQQLGVLVSVVKSHIKPYLKNIFVLIREFWTPETPMKSTLIMLTEQLAVALGSEFKPYITELMPAILRVFQVDNLENRIVTLKVLDTLKTCGPILEEHLHVVLPPIIKLFDPPIIGNDQQDENALELAKSALETLCAFADTMNLSQHASRFVHALARCLETFPAVRQDAFTLLYSIAIQTGKNFLVFAPLVEQIIQKHKLGTMAASYLGVIIRLEQDGRIYLEEELLLKKRTAKRAAHHLSLEPIDSQFKKIHCNVAWLQKTWSVSRCVSKEDWIEWLRRLSVELLKESPYPALRACWSVAQNHYPLAKELFNAAFTSCWTELIQTVQDDLINSLKQALNFQEVPEITQTVLNLAEFMDHSEKGPLPIEPSLLGERALKTRAYAKALRYTENRFNESCDATVLESLISINNKLQLQEAAHGVIEFAKRRDISITIKERWYEKLHDWQKALDAYEHKQEQNPLDIELTLGRMRCLEALGEWGKLNALAKDKWNSSSVEIKQNMSKMAAAAAWGEGNWDSMEEYVRYVNQNTLDGSLFRAVKFIHDGKNNIAQQFIDKARGLVDTELMSLASESYNRAYSTMVTVQLLSELEEAIQFKMVPEKRRLISQTWAFRLKGCQNTVEDWHRILQVRSLVLSPWEMRKTWIKFASLCRKNNKPSLAYKVLSMFGFDLVTENRTTLLDRPDLVYAYCKQMYYSGKVESATANLKLLLETSLKSQILQRIDLNERAELWTLKAKCYLKLGQWLEAGRSDNDPPSLQVMHYYRYATEWEKNWYKAWHALACTNFSAILYYKQQIAKAAGISSCRTSGALSSEMETSVSTQSSAYYGQKLSPENLIHNHAVNAVQCFFRSIALCKGNSLQDTLRLLTLWFEYGQNPEVYDTLYEGIKTVRVETWLQVIPQLIARIDTPRQLVSRLIMQLLMDVGKEHPQALVCPLTVAVKSNNKNRAFAATRILTHIGDHSPSLVTQAALLSDELIRVAILWHELWHESLEEASRQYFAERNTGGMFATLEPLHNMIEVGPTTLKEQSFTQSYARDLKEAKLWCEKFKNSQNNKELTQAWDLYYNVFRRISKQLPQLTTLELHYISPKLLLCQNMELAVPGTYDPSRPIIKIQSIHPTLHVITSKQRPRKICIKGSDGKDYWFLLKGHEDPRQDERVMQLFGLVNTLLMQDPTTSRRNLTIQRYSVTPLSQNSGLIGWVPNCDTLHALLRDYRDKKKVLLNIEHKLMQRMAPDYDHLTLMQKVEVFEHAMEHSNGDDLQKILWLKSPSSEVWFDRRTNYTRSLATMSMVGYILGLGDRHPSNLMLDRMSGKIVHIDFGDCFEVAMTREKYPEKIPFRLTRMLIKAMEVTGLEGNFRITCERVMTVLREHKESVMAVLEAFVYDPLINWRLVEQCNTGKKTDEDEVLQQLTGVENLKTNGGVGAGVNSSNVNTVKTKLKSEDSKNELTLVDQTAEVGSKRALQVIQRIRDKLAGRDFNPIESLDVHTQVELLVQQAISHENLCQCYIGWCPFW